MISPPTDPLAREVASGPKLTPNSLAISYFILSIACLAPGTRIFIELLLLELFIVSPPTLVECDFFKI